MKRILIFMTALALLFIGCTKEDVSLSEEQIEFFNVMGEKIPYMKPDTTVDVASTNEFTITNKDIMQNVYQGLRGDVQVLDNADQAQIEGYLKQIINIKAQQELLLAEAAKENLSVSEDSIDV